MTRHGPHGGAHPQDPRAPTAPMPHAPCPAHRPGDPHPGALPEELAGLLAEIVPPGGAFRHREHIHLAYLAVQRHGADLAADEVAGWIRHLAAYQRAPQKFNATVTRAWIEIVAHHMAAAPPGTDFAAFADRYPALLDKRLLTRHYSARPGLPGGEDRLGGTRPGRLPVALTTRHGRPLRSQIRLPRRPADGRSTPPAMTSAGAPRWPVVAGGVARARARGGPMPLSTSSRAARCRWPA